MRVVKKGIRRAANVMKQMSAKLERKVLLAIVTCLGFSSTATAVPEPKPESPIIADTTAPIILHSPCQVFGPHELVQIRVRFLDQSRLVAPRVAYRKTGESSWSYATLAWDTSSQAFAAELPAGLEPGFDYFIEVYDEHGNGPSRVGGPDTAIAAHFADNAKLCNQLPPVFKRPKASSEVGVSASMGEITELPWTSLFYGRVDVGAAMFLTRPQNSMFDTLGGSATGKLGIRLSRIPDSFLRQVAGEIEAGWFGFSRATNGRDGGVGFGGLGIAVDLRDERAWLVPRIDAHAGVGRTGALNRFMCDATLAADFDLGLARLGPFVKYIYVVSDPGDGELRGGAHLVAAGATLAIGPTVALPLVEGGPGANGVAYAADQVATDGQGDSEESTDGEQGPTEWMIGDVLVSIDKRDPTTMQLAGLTVDIAEGKTGSLEIDGLAIELANREGLVLSGFPISIDPDQDFVPGKNDACPQQSEDLDGYRDEDGCPDPDNDDDGVLDGNDACPNVPGDTAAGPTRGCPREKTAAAQISREKTSPKQSWKDMPEFREVVKAVESRQLLFPFGRAHIGPAQQRMFRELATILEKHPEVFIRIEGHTDYIGPKKYNEKLSLWRAQVIRRQLMKRGIAGERIEVRGHGESKPIAPVLQGNSYRARRARRLNRRVEFFVLDETFRAAPDLPQ